VPADLLRDPHAKEISLDVRLCDEESLLMGDPEPRPTGRAANRHKGRRQALRVKAARVRDHTQHAIFLLNEEDRAMLAGVRGEVNNMMMKECLNELTVKLRVLPESGVHVRTRQRTTLPASLRSITG
jgi:hypothetical protein